MATEHNKIYEPEDAAEMSLATARAILQDVVDTHEDIITDETRLDSVSGHSVGELRTAHRLVAQSIIKEFGSDTEVFGALVATKQTDGDTFHLGLRESSIDTSLLGQGVQFKIESNFPLEEPGSLTRVFMMFEDTRTKTRVRMIDIEENPTVAGFQQMWKGIRWMSANMLTWGEPRIILPEQLSKKSLPGA